MRIQHNIMAMNAYRNYTNNTNALSQNLEKLSSGYKINRAGDDAAGLAISEKMRAQISGLEQAQDNAKSGKNLVNTAEGALQEVHDMLNRMVTLADQSANGTFDNETDRAALQDEVDQLMDEIDRIADSANYNGINLLDGSLAASNVSGVGVTDVAATASSATMEAFAPGTGSSVPADGDTFEYTVSWEDSDGNGYSTTVSLKYDKTNKTLLDKDGNVLSAVANTTTSPAAAEIGGAVMKALQSDNKLTSAFTITSNAGALTFKSKTTGADAPKITSALLTPSAPNHFKGGAINGTVTEGADATQQLDFSNVSVVTSTADATEDDVFTIGGKKFVFAANNATVDKFANLDSDVTVIALSGTSYNATKDAADVAGILSRVTGLDIKTSGNDVVYNGSDLATKGNGLTLQIGDTSDDFNQLTVSIQDMHAASLGISGISVADQKSAQAAVDVIKAAINTVSSVRGTLGAASNRLDHTMNNLSVMTENIQDAESTIRDTDVADEMMAYTKNNILVQSAQAMLAQANQVPQGVLQLLQ